MKTVYEIKRFLVLALLFSTALLLVRPVFAAEEQESQVLGQEIRAEAELAAKQLQLKIKSDLKDNLERPEIKTVLVARSANVARRSR